jgi:ribonuclease HI
MLNMLSVFQNLSWVYIYETVDYQMDSRDFQDLGRVLQSHEAHIHHNRASLFNLVRKIQEIDNQIVKKMISNMLTKISGGAGAGGVLYNPRGKRMLNYSWNLGVTTNNMAETYAMYQGVLLDQERKFNNIIVIGDSKNTIRHFIKGTAPKKSKMKRIIERIKALLSSFQTSFSHVPCKQQRGR